MAESQTDKHAQLASSGVEALIDRLREQGVDAGRAEADKIVVEARRRAAQIVAAVVAMARELGLKVTAEGIETEAHHRLVTEAGCHLGQGFLMARPVPAANLHG